MDNVFVALKDTPIPTILVVAGIVFLLLSIAGHLAGKIVVSPERQRWAAAIGGVLTVLGVVLYIIPSGRPSDRQEVAAVQQVSPSDVHPSNAGALVTETESASPGASDRVSSAVAAPVAPPAQDLSHRSTTTPGDSMDTARLIPVGTTIRDLAHPGADRFFFKFNATGNKTRVILRKLSVRGFRSVVEVYDRAEHIVAQNVEGVALLAGVNPQDQPVTLGFETDVGETYYVVLKLFVDPNVRGDFELAVHNE
jgi:hypothetical protein